MTRDEILNMPAGREMDALVAEKVMGKPKHYYDCPHFDDEGRMLGFCSCPDLPRFSINIADAWKVVEKLKEQFIDIAIDNSNRWICTFQCFAIANTAPLAICRAALLAVGENR